MVVMPAAAAFFAMVVTTPAGPTFPMMVMTTAAALFAMVVAAPAGFAFLMMMVMPAAPLFAVVVATAAGFPFLMVMMMPAASAFLSVVVITADGALHRFRRCRSVQIGHIVVVIVLIKNDVEIHAVDAVLFHAAHIHREALRGNGVEGTGQHLQIRPEIDQCADEHIAADAGRPLDIQYFLFCHQICPLSASRLICVAT